MAERFPSSQKRFQEIQAELREQRDTIAQGKRGCDRSAWQLLRLFFGLLTPHTGMIAAALTTLTLSTLLALIPPASTKFVIDYVLGDKPLPSIMPEWVPRDRFPLLLTVAAGVFLITLVKIGFGIWGRWQATRITKLVQMDVRRNFSLIRCGCRWRKSKP